MASTLSQTYGQKSAENKSEIELLLACSRTKILPELKIKIKSLVQQNIDWQNFIHLGNRHQLIPIIYHNLAAICKDSIPTTYLAQMRQVYVYNAQKNIFITGELIKICCLFEEHNIYAIPFKGMTLAMTAYKNLSFRDSCDIDILISKQDFPVATKLLSCLGYQTTGYIAEVENNLDLRYGDFLQSENNQKGYDLINKSNGIAIDLQWSLTEKAKSQYFSLDFEQLKANAGGISLADHQIPQFNPETMVLYLCFHGSKHCWQSLKWVCDLAEFMGSHPELDWQKIVQQAKKLKLTSMLHLGIYLVNDFYQTPVPQELSSVMNQNSRAYMLYGQVRQLIFTRCFTQWEDYAFVYKITDSWLGKLQFASALLFTPTTKEWKEIQLPKFLFPLYYLIRPYRLTREYLAMSNKSYKS